MPVTSAAGSPDHYLKDELASPEVGMVGFDPGEANFSVASFLKGNLPVSDELQRAFRGMRPVPPWRQGDVYRVERDSGPTVCVGPAERTWVELPVLTSESRNWGTHPLRRRLRKRLEVKSTSSTHPTTSLRTVTPHLLGSFSSESEPAITQSTPSRPACGQHTVRSCGDRRDYRLIRPAVRELLSQCMEMGFTSQNSLPQSTKITQSARPHRSRRGDRATISPERTFLTTFDLVHRISKPYENGLQSVPSRQQGATPERTSSMNAYEDLGWGHTIRFGDGPNTRVSTVNDRYEVTTLPSRIGVKVEVWSANLDSRSDRVQTARSDSVGEAFQPMQAPSAEPRCEPPAPDPQSGTSSEPHVSIIVLNWNGARDTLDCIRSLFSMTYQNCEIIIVDNGSTDQSQNVIEREVRTLLQAVQPAFAPTALDTLGTEIRVISEAAARAAISGRPAGLPLTSRVVLIRNESNLGFAAGNNIGIEFAVGVFKPFYVLLLNNDTVVEPTFLTKLVSMMETQPKLAILAPRLVEEQPTNTIPRTPCLVGNIHWMRFPGFSYGLPRERGEDTTMNAVLKCDWVSGAGMLIRSTCLEYGLLNAAYFFGCEDVELCIKLRESGWIVGVCPDAIVWHKRGVARMKRYRTRFRAYISSALGPFRLVRNNRRHYVHLWYLYAMTVAFLALKLKVEDRFKVRINLAETLKGLQ